MHIFPEQTCQGSGLHDHALVKPVREDQVLFRVEIGPVRHVLVKLPLVVTAGLKDSVHATNELVEHTVISLDHLFFSYRPILIHQLISRVIGCIVQQPTNTLVHHLTQSGAILFPVVSFNQMDANFRLHLVPHKVLIPKNCRARRHVWSTRLRHSFSRQIEMRIHCGGILVRFAPSRGSSVNVRCQVFGHMWVVIVGLRMFAIVFIFFFLIPLLMWAWFFFQFSTMVFRVVISIFIPVYCIIRRTLGVA
uniref:Uncharacterized protein n=2 Tax=Cacopsylla melanoneura TaxID=428564 RepID=A0A8D8YER9_9HEMI